MADEKKGFLLRLPPALFEELRRWADQDMRSINGQIEWLLREAVVLRRRRLRDAEGDGERSPDTRRDAPP